LSVVAASSRAALVAVALTVTSVRADTLPVASATVYQRLSLPLKSAVGCSVSTPRASTLYRPWAVLSVLAPLPPLAALYSSTLAGLRMLAAALSLASRSTGCTLQKPAGAVPRSLSSAVVENWKAPALSCGLVTVSGATSSAMGKCCWREKRPDRLA